MLRGNGRSCNASTCAQAALICHDDLPIREDSKSDSNRKEVQGTTMGLREEGAHVGEHLRANWKRSPVYAFPINDNSKNGCLYTTEWLLHCNLTRTAHNAAVPWWVDNNVTLQKLIALCGHKLPIIIFSRDGYCTVSWSNESSLHPHVELLGYEF